MSDKTKNYPAPPPPPEPPATEVEQPVEVVAESVGEAVVAPAQEPIDTSEIESGHMPVKEEVAEEVPADEPKTEEASEEADEVKPDDAPKTDEVKTDEPVAEPVVIDATAELPVVLEKVTEVLDRYELPADVQTAIDALRAKAEAVPPEPLAVELADYGDIETIKSVLDRDNYLSSVTEVEEGKFRPNTDKFVAELQKNAPDKADWLYFDLAQTPSGKYAGLSKFEEGICDVLAKPGDTIGTVLARYNKAMTYAKDGIPTSEVPAFIPQELYEAFASLSKESREEIGTYAPEEGAEDYFAQERLRKLDELQKIQKGIDADKRDAISTVQTQQQKQTAFNTEVAITQRKFFNGMRDSFTESLLKEVVFHPDPKMQNFLGRQQVTTVAQAFLDDADGEYARETLEAAGIKFDNTKAQQLVKGVEKASVALIVAQKQVDANGKQLNPVELNKAKREFEDAGREWQKFAADIIKQEKEITATGTETAVKEAVAKQKIVPKARAAVKTTPSDATPKPQAPVYQSKEWYDKIAEDTLNAAAKKARAYA